MRYRNQTAMHDDTENAPAPLDNTPKQECQSPAEYNKDPDPCCDLAKCRTFFNNSRKDSPN